MFHNVPQPRVHYLYLIFLIKNSVSAKFCFRTTNVWEGGWDEGWGAELCRRLETVKSSHKGGIPIRHTMTYQRQFIFLSMLCTYRAEN